MQLAVHVCSTLCCNSLYRSCLPQLSRYRSSLLLDCSSLHAAHSCYSSSLLHLATLSTRLATRTRSIAARSNAACCTCMQHTVLQLALPQLSTAARYRSLLLHPARLQLAPRSPLDHSSCYPSSLLHLATLSPQLAACISIAARPIAARLTAARCTQLALLQLVLPQLAIAYPSTATRCTQLTLLQVVLLHLALLSNCSSLHATRFTAARFTQSTRWQLALSQLAIALTCSTELVLQQLDLTAARCTQLARLQRALLQLAQVQPAAGHALYCSTAARPRPTAARYILQFARQQSLRLQLALL
jgi:hypothetical protein